MRVGSFFYLGLRIELANLAYNFDLNIKFLPSIEDVMKWIAPLLFVLIIFCCNYTNGQYYYEKEKEKKGNSDDIDRKEALYSSKIESYTKLKNTGLTLAAIGGGLTVAGVALVASSEWETVPNGNGGTTFYAKDSNGAYGIISLLGGVPLLVTGIILERIGNRKVKQYSEKLYNLNLGFDYSPNYKGITLTYRF